MKHKKWIWIPALIWAALPWAFWGVYQFHKPDHADPFWLPMMPLVLISFIPALFAHGAADQNGAADPNWFPLAWVVGSSVFNLVAGAVLAVIAVVWRKWLNTWLDN